MPVELHHEEAGKYLNITLVGTITKDDYKPLAAEFERLTTEHGKLRVLLDMTRFHGWEASAIWQEIKFDLKNLDKLGRLAVVGEARWQHAIATFTKPLTPAEVRYFDGAQAAEAKAWLTSVPRGVTAA